MSDNEQPPPPESAPAAATLGQTLRNARLAQELTVEQIAAELRIEAKQLKALEDDRFEVIGVPVFIKGYLKQYGQRLGVDVRDLLVLYYRQTEVSDVQIRPNRTIKLRNERQITSWLLAGIVLLTVVVGLAVWWWNGGSFDIGRSPASDPVTPAPTPAPSEPRRATEPAAQPPAREVPPPVAPAGQAGVEAVVAAPAAVIPERVGVRDEGLEPPGAALPAVTIPLEFTFEAESWTEVSDARGERLLFGMSAAGRRVTVRGEPPFAILLGNANAVRLVVDGEEYPIPTRGREGELARFSVDIAEE